VSRRQKKLINERGEMVINRGEKGFYTVKKVNNFPVPSRDLTYQTLPDRE
jgi:hypothetical protein